MSPDNLGRRWPTPAEGGRRPRPRGRPPEGPLCAVCQKTLHPLMAQIANTHPCCDPHDTEPIPERRR